MGVGCVQGGDAKARKFAVREVRQTGIVSSTYLQMAGARSEAVCWNKCRATVWPLREDACRTTSAVPLLSVVSMWH